MSAYYCHRCDAIADNDFVPCVSDPQSPTGQFWLMCDWHEDEDSDEEDEQKMIDADQRSTVVYKEEKAPVATCRDKRLKNLGYTNARGKTYDEIERVRRLCIDVHKHDPKDVDPRRVYGHHEIQCMDCGYVYYEDSGD